MRPTALFIAALLAGAASAETLTYSYDAHGRLTLTQRSGGPSSGVSTRHGFDQADNRSLVWSGSGTMPSAPSPRPPAFTIDDATLAEGHSLTFTVTRHGSINSSYTVDYATAGGTATSGTDFTAASGTLTFGPDEFSRTVSVESSHDTAFEANETFVVNLANPSGGATVSDSQGAGTIVNDDPSNYPPTPAADSGTAVRCDEVGTLFNVTANDTDPEGHYPLTLINVDSVSGGAEAEVGNATSVRFRGGSGNSSVVVYRVRDSLGAEATGTLTVTVSGAQCQ